MGQVRGPGRHLTFRSTPQRKLMFAVGLLVAVLGAVFASITPSATAATTATAITDYATYPQADLIPGTCHTDGAGVLQGITYTVVHNGATTNGITHIDQVQLFAGDTVTIHWTDYTAGCEGIGVSLAVKATDHPVFNINDNQHLVGFTFCSGADCGNNGTGFGNLSITIPDPTTACNFQFDAVIGPPLANVGPNGSYYGPVNRVLAGKSTEENPGPNMLLGFSNGGKGICLPPTVQATQSCTTASGPGVDVAITNPDDDDAADVKVLKGSDVVAADVLVAVGAPAEHVFVPFDVNETDTVTVIDKHSGETVFTQEFVFDCVHPNATIADNCAEGGTVITFANTGESPVDFDVFKDGVKIDTVHVGANDTVDKTYAMDEDTSATFQVTSVDYDSGEVPITHDCVQVEDSTTTTSSSTTSSSTSTTDTVAGTEQTRTLPRTGSGSTMGLSTASGVLLMVGGLLMALANRPLPSTVTTKSRGR